MERPSRRTVGRASIFRRRGRAVYQRQSGSHRLLLRSGRPGSDRSAPRRAVIRWRVELRGGERLHPVFVSHHDQRLGRLSRARARHGVPPTSRRPASRGQEYLLERRLFHRLSTGEVVDPAWTHFFFPTLAALRRVERARLHAQRRCRSRTRSGAPRRSSWSRRDAAEDGRWPMQHPYPGEVHFDIDDGRGASPVAGSLWSCCVSLEWLSGHSTSEVTTLRTMEPISLTVDDVTYAQLALATIDHSLLKPTLTSDDVRAGCRASPPTIRSSRSVYAPAVCPGSRRRGGSDRHRRRGRNRDQLSARRNSTTATKVFESQRAMEDGAVELDMVLNIGWLLSGENSGWSKATSGRWLTLPATT